MAEDVTSETEVGAEGPGPCLACRATGKVVSNLGGSPHEVTCPWCLGTGTRIPGRDAQEGAAEHPAGQGSPPAPAA